MRVFTYCISFVVLITTNVATAQDIHIIDSESGEGIAYAQVGVPDQGKGAIADSNGVLKIDENWAQPTDTVVFSNLGFSEQRIVFSDLLNRDTVFLAPVFLNLNTVDVKPKGPKEYVQAALKTAPYYFARQPVNTLLEVHEEVIYNSLIIEYNKALLKGYFVPLIDFNKDTSRIIIKALKHWEDYNIELFGEEEDEEDVKEFFESMTSLLTVFNPYKMWDSTVVRHLHRKPESLDDYNFRIDRIDSSLTDTTMYVNMYNKRSEKRSQVTGQAVLDYNNLYIQSLSTSYDLKGPMIAALKAVFFVAGVKINTVTFSRQDSYESVSSKYVPNEARLKTEIELEKIRIFRDNEIFNLKIEQTYTMIDTKIPATDKCYDGVPVPKEKHFSEAVKGDLNPELIDF